MTPKQEAALRLALEALDDRTSLHKWQKAREAIREALAEQPVQPCGYPYCGCNSKAWCKVEQQSGIKQVIELYDSPEQPVQQQEPVACKTLCELCVNRGYIKCANAAKTTPIPSPQPAQHQEPVAYIRKDQLQKAAQSPMLCEVTPEPRQDRIGIYTSPPASKPWVGLSEEDRVAINQSCLTKMQAAASTEAILREKNNG